MISIIAAVGQNNELGLNNDLVFHIREDMKYFKDTTTGRPILMGKKTLDSIGKPLPNRTNYIAAFTNENLPNNVIHVSDLHHFLKEHEHDDEEYFVCGGATIYREALPYAQHLYLTEVDATADADVFFPDFDHSHYSRQVIKKGKEHDLTYSFVKYTKK